MKIYKITEQLVNVLINYLATKSYAETWQIIPLLQKLEEIKEEVKIGEKPKIEEGK
jgi:hypothetical protein